MLSRHSATPLHGRLWVFGGSMSARPASGAAAMGSAAAKRGRVRCPTPNSNPDPDPNPNPNPNPSPNQELLAGDGYYSRSDPRQLARLDGSAPKRGIYDQAPGADGGAATQLSQAQKNSRLANRDTVGADANPSLSSDPNVSPNPNSNPNPNPDQVGADNMLQPESEGGAATQGGYPHP